jgi:replicative DNA helicase
MEYQVALEVAALLAIKKNIPVCFVTNKSAESIIQDLLVLESGVSKEMIEKGDLTPLHFSSITEGCGKIYEAPFYIMDYSVETDAALAFEKEKGVKAIFYGSRGDPATTIVFFKE